MNYIAGTVFVLLAFYSLITAVSNVSMAGSRFMVIPSLVTVFSHVLIAVGLFTAIYPLVSAGAGVGILYSFVYVVAFSIHYDVLEYGGVAVIISLLIAQFLPILYNVFVLIGGLVKKAALVLCIVAAVILLVSTLSGVVSLLSASAHINIINYLPVFARIAGTVLAGVAISKRPAPAVY